MVWANFHTHCNLCDGIGNPGDYIEEAVNRHGMKILGFSSHASLPFETDWNMTKVTEEKYPLVIKQFKQEYRDRINIKLGLEIDYIPGIAGTDMHGKKQLMGLDYSIGSVHFIERYKSGAKAGEFIPIDGKDTELEEGIKDTYNGNVRKAVETYYLILQEMISRGGFDIIGHLDLIKKNNRNGKYFSEDEKWYRDIVEKTLLVVSKSGLIVEVNTGGMSRNYTDSPYPSYWILERCLKLKIPITLNSDAHSPSHLTASFQQTAKALLEIGFKELHVLEEKSWEPRSFSPFGLIG